METKVFAAYLPQYHETEENNQFWGEGFTDWIGVKNATPQFEGHKQPKVPLNENYYDLSDYETIKWQAAIAKQYGINGFNIYHYWFKDGKKMLYKPAELLLSHTEIDIEFFFSWDNTSWVRSWSNIKGIAWTSQYGEKKDGKEILLEMEYGDESAWTDHYKYLAQFFKDERYLKIDNKPVFALMNSSDKETISNMKIIWDELAKKDGFNGVFMMTGARIALNKDFLDSLFFYEPRISAWGKREAIEKYISRLMPNTLKEREKYYYDYKRVWKAIIRNAIRNKKKNIYYGGVVTFDDTPRRGKRARILTSASPELFGSYFEELYRISKKNNKEILLLTAWNEWGEGSYLEPDKENGYKYLEELKAAIERVDKSVK